jgi:hypothetical protein
MSSDLLPCCYARCKIEVCNLIIDFDYILIPMIGFSRCCRGPDAGAYYHPHFLRGKRMLTRHILRTKIKGCGNKTTIKRQDSDPDFYAMAPLEEDHESTGGYSAAVDAPPTIMERPPVPTSSILIYELAMVCTTLCNLRKDTSV